MLHIIIRSLKVSYILQKWSNNNCHFNGGRLKAAYEIQLTMVHDYSVYSRTFQNRNTRNQAGSERYSMNQTNETKNRLSPSSKVIKKVNHNVYST